MQKVHWRLFYDDGSTFDNTMGKPKKAPGYGLVCAVFNDRDENAYDTGRMIMHGWDYYFWHPVHREWWGCNLTGLLDRLAARLPMEAVCIGRTIKTKDFRAIMDRAHKDPDFRPKSAKKRNEQEFKKEGPETQAMKKEHGT
jgi:hypothetical protein